MATTKFKVATGRFGSTTEEEIAKILEEKSAKNTNRATQTSLNCLREYLKCKDQPILEEVSDEELPEILLGFYTNMRTKKEHDLYKTGSMKSMRSNINRYFKTQRNIDIISDPRFIKANEIFKGMTVQAKKVGKGVTTSTVPIDDIDMQKLYIYFNSMDNIAKPNPKILQQYVFFNILYYTCRRGIENLEEMKKNHYKVVVNYDGTRHVEQAIDELDKNHREDYAEMANEAKIYENPDAGVLCPVNCFQLYVDKLNPKIDRLWQRAKTTSPHYNDAQWYDARPLGKDTIEKMMKTLIKNAELTNPKYTNHSIRKTCLQVLGVNGYQTSHMAFISGHQSESSVRVYATKCPEPIKRNMYSTLAETIGLPTKKIKTTASSTVSKPPSDVTPNNENVDQTLQILDLDKPNFTLEFGNDSSSIDFSDVSVVNLDDYHDKILVDYLNKTEKQLQHLLPNNEVAVQKENPPVSINIPVNTVAHTPKPPATVQNFNTVQNTMSNPANIPVMPKMFFPNSNVTINYNFGK